MMNYYAFFSGLLLVLSLSVSPALAEFEEIEILRDEVKTFLQHTYHEGSAVHSEEQLEVAVGSLDPRLRLARCDSEKAMAIANPHLKGQNVTVKVACQGKNRWNIYVPARINIYAEVVMASRSLARGHIIGADDIRFERQNTSLLGYGHIEDPARVVGMELKKQLRAGDAIKLSHLVAPHVIHKGDKVVLEAVTAGLSVIAPGIAMSSGQVGDQIKVRNSDSQRVVDVLIVAPGRVRVVL